MEPSWGGAVFYAFFIAFRDIVIGWVTGWPALLHACRSYITQDAARFGV